MTAPSLPPFSEILILELSMEGLAEAVTQDEAIDMIKGINK